MPRAASVPAADLVRDRLDGRLEWVACAHRLGRKGPPARPTDSSREAGGYPAPGRCPGRAAPKTAGAPRAKAVPTIAAWC